jgi:plastocyanin
MRKLAFASLIALIGGVAGANAADTSTIKGQVVWGGADVPKQADLNVTKDQQHCLSKGSVKSEEIVVNPDNKGMKNVFVWITKEDNSSPPVPANLKEPKKKSVELDQPVCAFEPHAMAIQQGTDVIVKNTAPVAHNVNWNGGVKNPGDNKIVPPGGHETMKPKLKASKDAVAISCNIHGWMRGWIRVFDHPYFAVTDKDGNFEIKDAPVGKYKIWYWSDSGWKDGVKGSKGFPIDIKSGTTDLGKVEWKP